MNKWIGSGRLARDPEVRYSADGKAFAKFTLAVKNPFAKNGEPTADYIDCTAFEKKAELVEKYVRQGIKLFVSGRIKSGSYKARDGHTVYTKEIIADELEFAESKASQTNRETTSESEQPKPATDGDGFMKVPDNVQEELPFT